ncbi:MAG: class I SAM-dependent methyltransferase [Gammaproteobacteria bacterium]|nr:class I SAM-dependent methyltransferase [Gammaproteobacteria bacterium]
MINDIAFVPPKNVPQAECRRLFHGRGKAYPGYQHVNIDWLPPVALIMLYEPVDTKWLAELADTLMSRIDGCRSVQVQHRYQEKSPTEVLLGEALTEIVVTEDGLKFYIQLGRLQNYGLFLDMRNGRRWVREQAADKRVLNLFAYTCAFSVAALAGGARKVVNFDNNKSVLQRGRENHRLNNQDTAHVVFEGVDIFRSWSRLRKHGPYDLLICDPPAFQVGSVNIGKDYQKIIRRLPEFMAPGGLLVLCLNAPNLDQNFLHEIVSAECDVCRYTEIIPLPEAYKETVSGQGTKVSVFEYRPDQA